MRKFFVGIVLVAVIAFSVFAFVACDSGYTPNAEEGWSADTQFLRGNISATINFVSDKHWRVDIGGAMADLSVNDNWCRGEYFFEGAVGESALHMWLYGPEDYLFEEFGEEEQNNVNDPAYDPSSVRMIDENDQAVDYGQEVVFYPDEAGVYTVRLTLYGWMEDIFNLGGDPADAYMVFLFYPPQDGTLGSNGDLSPVPPSTGPNMMAIIIGVSVAVVVVIVAIVVTVVLVKKNKKKKAAAGNAEAAEKSASDAETPTDGEDAD